MTEIVKTKNTILFLGIDENSSFRVTVIGRRKINTSATYFGETGTFLDTKPEPEKCCCCTVSTSLRRCDKI